MTVKSVCVYCGSRPGAMPAYAQAADTLGTAIAAAGWHVRKNSLVAAEPVLHSRSQHSIEPGRTQALAMNDANAGDVLPLGLKQKSGQFRARLCDRQAMQIEFGGNPELSAAQLAHHAGLHAVAFIRFRRLRARFRIVVV